MKNKKVIIIIGIIVGLLLLGFLLFFLLQNNKRYTVTFDSNGGSKVLNAEVKKGESLTLPTVTKEGYIFNGWYENNNKVSSKIKVTKDMTLVAKWLEEDAKTYTITFDSDGGSKVEDLIVECDTELTLPKNPTKDGYEFVSWIDKNETPILDQALLACENITLKANWKKVEEKKEETKKEETKKEETKKQETVKEVTYSCPNGYTLSGTKCTMTKTATSGCDKQTEGKYNNKCYAISSYQQPTCKVYTGNTSAHSGQPNLVDGTVINSGSTIYCVAESMTLSGCEQNGGTRINGSSCYKYAQTTTASTVCSSYSGYDFIVGNALYDVSIGRTNVKDGCYKGTALHLICEDGYTLSNDKCVKTIDATAK